MSNTIYKGNNANLILCDKICYLNKIMNGVDIYYAVELLAVYTAEHSVGNVMGKAKYGSGFSFYQNYS